MIQRQAVWLLDKLELKVQLQLVKTVTLLDFRRNAAAILERVEAGEECLLTRRGKASVRLVPANPPEPGVLPPDDPVFRMSDFVGKADEAQEPLTNEGIDRLVYGE